MPSDDDRELDNLSLRLKQMVENPDEWEDDEMVESKRCLFCGEEHHGEVYAAPPDGFKIRYWCPERERVHRTSYI